MKKATIIVLFMVFMVMFVGIEMISNGYCNSVNHELELEAYARNMKFGGIVHCTNNGNDDYKKLSDMAHKATEDIHDAWTEEIYYDVIGETDDGLFLVSVTKGANNIGKPEKNYLFALVGKTND